MSTTRAFEKQALKAMPTAFPALTKLIIAMTRVVRDNGKKTLFGKDKGEKAFSKFLFLLKGTIEAMAVDGLIKLSSTDEEVIEVLEAKLEEFSALYPVWEDGYEFAADFFGKKREGAIISINKLRLMK